jgi:hypothetical protein
MQLKMQARHLWDAVEYDDVDYDDDRAALDAICSGVPGELIPILMAKNSAKEAWEAIKTLRIGDERVRKATAQNLRAEYESIVLRDREPIEDFALRLTGIVQRLATLGDPEPDEKVVAKYLRVVRPRYKQLVISIETLLDISQLSIEEVTGRLKAADDVEPSPPQNASGKLLLTKEEWVERYKKKGQESSRGGSSSGGRGRGRGKGQGRGSGESRPPPDSPCPRCGKKGHWASDCRSKKKEEPAHQAYLAQEEEQEQTLMLAIGSAQEETPSFSPPTPPPPHPAAHTAPPPPTAELHLVERKVVPNLNEEVYRGLNQWILDTGASNHMTGSRAAFSDLDTAVTGSVRFGDGSVARIEGRGTILFSVKNGEHRSFTGVYFLPQLTANIISVGQLDEGGFQVLVEHGIMRIRDEERRLLAKVRRGAGRLYVLDVTLARPVCLAARTNDEAWRWHSRFGHLHFAALRKMARTNLTLLFEELNI